RDFPAAVMSAAEQYEPCVIASYLLDLASEFSGFLDACRVLSRDEALTRSRVALVGAVAVVMRRGLYLLGIPAPEKM
ncbi:MAG: DALR anticodon-binding domain-containing protein, partial [Planctomycetota bacterium]|nr:DALR anticodon-binding domain-containing protein [Planctomycetota bacterium]